MISRLFKHIYNNLGYTILMLTELKRKISERSQNRAIEKERDWVRSFEIKIQSEEMRLRSLYKVDKKRDGLNADKYEKVVDILEFKYRQLPWFNDWFKLGSSKCEEIKKTFFNLTKVKVSSREIKSTLRSYILKENFPKDSEKSFYQSFLVFLFLTTAKDRIVRREEIFLNEDKFQNVSLAIFLLLKKGAGESQLQGEAKKSFHKLVVKIKRANFDSTFLMLSKIKKLKGIIEDYNACNQRFRKFLSDEKRHKVKVRKRDPFNVKDALDILELTNVVDMASLKRKYKSKALENHPDRLLDTDKEDAHLRFCEIKDAYETLLKEVS